MNKSGWVRDAGSMKFCFRRPWKWQQGSKMSASEGGLCCAVN